MPARDRRLDRGRRRGVHLLAEIGNELRDSRVRAGLNQRTVGTALGWSHSKVGRVERGILRTVSLAEVAEHAAVLGLQLAARLYPDGSPVRDAAQLALIARFRALLVAGLKLVTEVALPITGDARAWDAIVYGVGAPIGVEAETRLGDIQALARRIALKQRDGQVELVVLLVSNTRWNRRVLREHEAALAAMFPTPGRSAIRALADGTPPAGSAIVVL